MSELWNGKPWVTWGGVGWPKGWGGVGEGWPLRREGETQDDWPSLWAATPEMQRDLASLLNMVRDNENELLDMAVRFSNKCLFYEESLGEIITSLATGDAKAAELFARDALDRFRKKS